MDERYDALLEKLWHAALRSETCTAACLASDRVGELTACIRLSRDVAEICMLLVRSVKRQSALVQPLLPTCIFICRACAEACDKQDADYCQQCAAACLLCSEACRSLIKGN